MEELKEIQYEITFEKTEECFSHTVSLHLSSLEHDDKVVQKSTTAQEAFSSLIGLVMATSGCPHREFFNPMAWFHQPFSNAIVLLDIFTADLAHALDEDLAALKMIFECDS